MNPLLKHFRSRNDRPLTSKPHSSRSLSGRKPAQSYSPCGSMSTHFYCFPVRFCFKRTTVARGVIGLACEAPVAVCYTGFACPCSSADRAPASGAGCGSSSLPRGTSLLSPFSFFSPSRTPSSIFCYLLAALISWPCPRLHTHPSGSRRVRLGSPLKRLPPCVSQLGASQLIS